MKTISKPFLIKTNRGSFIKEFTQYPEYESGCKLQIDIIEGCIYDCAYCFLKHYRNSEQIIIYENIGDLYEQLKTTKERVFNLSVVTDGSLFSYFDDITKELFNVIRHFPEKEFEIRFKHIQVLNLLRSDLPKNIVFSSTITTDDIQRTLEIGTSTNEERIDALKKLNKNGYGTSLIFDPVIIYDDWQKDYKKIIEMIDDSIKYHTVGIGLLRCEKTVYVEFLRSVNASDLKGRLRGEMNICPDGKYRYIHFERIEFYKKILSMLDNIKRKHTIIYMEKEDVKKGILP